MFQEFKKRIDKRTEEKRTSMLNKEGKEVETPNEINEIYIEYYKDLLKIKEGKDEEEKEIENNVKIA